MMDRSQLPVETKNIIVHMHTEDTDLLRYIEYSTHFWNYYCHTNLNDLMTIETVVNGIIFIFRDLQAFEL